MSKAVIAQKNPYAVDVVEGKSYYWCQCGQSAKQPFCDGSHAGTDFTPLKFDATDSNKVFFCGCKATNNSPMCDGTHSK